MTDDYVPKRTVRASTVSAERAPQNSESPLALVASLPPWEGDFSSMAGIDDETRRIAREFVEEALRTSGLTAYAMARKAGISPTTLTRLLNNPDHKVVPKLATLRKVGAVAGLTPPRLGGLDLESAPRPRWVPLVGEARYGTWVEDQAVGDDDEGIPVHLPRYEHTQLFALRNAGQPHDTKYRLNTAIVAAPADEVGVRLGDDVVIRRRQGAFSETSLREVTRDEAGALVLRALTTDPRQTPLPMPRSLKADGCSVEILGVVVASVREGRNGLGPDLPFDAD